MIKISFIVIGYNTEFYIERCIRSILKQTIREIEIIFVDDGSTDNTVNIVKEIAKKDNRIKIICQENQGANSARKTGFTYSNGEYVIFVDSDDWIDKNMGKELYETINKYKCDIICYNYILAYDDETKNKKITAKIYDNIEGNKYLELLIKQKIPHELANKIYKRELLVNARFNEVCKTSMGEDLAANILIAILKPKVKMVDKAYYFYYQRINSTMNNVTKRLLEIVDSLDFIEDVLRKNNLYDRYEKEFEYLWFNQCYYFNIIRSNVKHNKYHKKLFKLWKNKKINIGKNDLCKSMIKQSYRLKIVNFMYNVNYLLGDMTRILLYS